MGEHVVCTRDRARTTKRPQPGDRVTVTGPFDCRTGPGTVYITGAIVAHVELDTGKRVIVDHKYLARSR